MADYIRFLPECVRVSLARRKVLFFVVDKSDRLPMVFLL
jgi:hypothetical protein